MVDSGRLRPIIGKRYSLAEVPQAMADIGAGHSRGKVLIEIKNESE
jgi:NADPH:quinone reductase-like Zn-dependent oxidoreductase